MLKNVLQIIRWPNLLMLAGIQSLVYIKLVHPSSAFISVMDVCLLIFITVLIGAAGYVINDYYDADIDRINKPSKWLAGNVLSLQSTKFLFLALSFTGFVLSILLALRLGLMKYIFIYPLAITGLWFYSYALKCKPIIGNLWVSIFCAGVIGIVALPDMLLGISNAIKSELWYYMAFAFISTWYREVVKDIEDVEGDAKANCQTAVVRYGLMFGKWMAVVLGLFLVVSLLFWERQQTDHWIKLMLTVLEGFTVGSIAFVWWAKNNSYYHHASTIIKGVMIGGTLILIWV